MQRFYYALAIFGTFFAILWIRIRVGPLVALCLFLAPLFITGSIACYYVCMNGTPHDGSREERK